MKKQGLGMSVLEAARQRISFVFDNFPKVCVSFSGGKDSSVMLHLVAEEAERRGQKFGLLFVDLEAQYECTIEHVRELFELYADFIEPYWVSLPLSLRNAVSQYEPQWQCWDPGREKDWVRKPDKKWSITEESAFPFFVRGMEFEDFIERFAWWYGDGQLTASLVGIRCDESLNRYRTIFADSKQMFEGKVWTTYKNNACYSAFPLYDWRTADIWRYNSRSGKPYNRLYDLMHKAGLSIHQQRICQPYGDDQRKGLWLFHLIEPETWGKVVARVNGANQGANYARESGNILGVRKVSKPGEITWEEFAERLLKSMPPKTREHFENKIAVFIQWYSVRGYPHGIPDEGPANSKKEPSWTRICKTLLRNDYWCKGLSFSQHKSEAYEKYERMMKKRRAKWGSIFKK